MVGLVEEIPRNPCLVTSSGVPMDPSIAPGTNGELGVSAPRLAVEVPRGDRELLTTLKTEVPLVRVDPKTRVDVIPKNVLLTASGDLGLPSATAVPSATEVSKRERVFPPYRRREALPAEAKLNKPSPATSLLVPSMVSILASAFVALLDNSVTSKERTQADASRVPTTPSPCSS